MSNKINQSRFRMNFNENPQVLPKVEKRGGNQHQCDETFVLDSSDEVDLNEEQGIEMM